MTRTTELLKGCGMNTKVYTSYKWYSKRFNLEICGKDNKLCDNCKSELRGRLDALKEDAIKLQKRIQIIKYYVKEVGEIKDSGETVTLYQSMLRDKETSREELASIQEEIKLIEEKI